MKKFGTTARGGRQCSGGFPVVTMDISGCRAGAIGEYGLSDQAYKKWLAQIQPHFAALQAKCAAEQMPLFAALSRSDDIEEAAQALRRLSFGARDVLFFGIGGSSLGGQTLRHFSESYVPDVCAGPQESCPNISFYENLDPTTLNHIFERYNLSTTRFVVISKSGSTAETLFQMMAALQAVKDVGLADYIPQIFLGVTERGPDKAGEDKRNGLRALCEAHGIPVLEHHPDISGRFSVFTNVGILPGLARGVDVYGLRAGARNLVMALLQAKTAADFAPAVGAAVGYGLNQDHNIRSRVIMPYVDRLRRLSNWFVQLWAESLGKQEMGTTPIAALGPADQHSQLQLFLDGPRDHMVTLITTDCQGMGPRIAPELAELAGVKDMGGRTAGDLLAAEQRAIHQALIARKRPVQLFEVRELDACALGELMAHFMFETILTAYMMGIDPFDQPAVETGKELTRSYLAEMAAEAKTGHE